MLTSTALRLSDLVDLDDLADAINDGYIHRQTHPTLPLTILNYTNKTQAEAHWTPATMTCRGLIIDSNTSEIVARPFAKFFTYGQRAAGPLPLDAPARVLDKLDGSLGILYPVGDGRYAIATRGSFTSAQAIHATKVWNNYYADQLSISPGPGHTYLFEIIYPGNRIVVDYDGLDNIVLLGAVNNRSGRFVTPGWIEWPGRKAEQFSYFTLGEALAAPPRPGAEGLVVYLPQQNTLVKIKQDDYLALHAVLTKTTARNLWEYLAVNAVQHLITKPKDWASLLHLDPRRAERCLGMGPDWLDRLLDRVPDEFHAWVRRTISGLTDSVAVLAREVEEYAQLARYVYGDDRKAMAAEVAAHPEQGLVFKRISGDDITAQLWVRFYPDADRPWLVQEEDAA